MRHSADIRNLRPDCLIAEVHCETQEGLAEKPRIYLSLAFAEEEINLMGNIRVLYGLRGARLEIDLDNARIMLRDRKLCGDLELTRQEDITTENTGDNRLEFNLPSRIIKSGIQKTAREAKATKSIRHTISCQGTSAKPRWRFDSLDPAHVPLKGALQDAELGAVTVDLDIETWGANIAFSFRQSDIFIRGTGGIWPPENIECNKKAVLERLIVKWLISKELVTPLCFGTLEATTPRRTRVDIRND